MGKRPVTLVLAATVPRLGIGKDGSLPWRLKREMKFFRQTTDSSVVIMGRRTWESIPAKFRPLPNRMNIVVSTRPTPDYGHEDVLAAKSVEEALALSENHHVTRPIFVIGGAQIYKAILPVADRILLTQIEDPYESIECDTFFDFNRNQWKPQSSARLHEVLGPGVELPEETIEESGLTYTFTLWERTASLS